jgi:hypothetical protein
LNFILPQQSCFPLHLNLLLNLATFVSLSNERVQRSDFMSFPFQYGNTSKRKWRSSGAKCLKLWNNINGQKRELLYVPCTKSTKFFKRVRRVEEIERMKKVSINVGPQMTSEWVISKCVYW